MNCLCNLFDSEDFVWFVILALLIIYCGGSGNSCGCGCGNRC